jgi:hypothetical protein
MMMRPPAPDDRPARNGQLRPRATSPGLAEPLDVQRAALALLWDLALRRFRSYLQRAAGRGGPEEDE